MDRFSQLEFGEASPEKKASGEPVRDEKYFIDLALKYWLAGDWELALRNYSRALEKNNTVFEAWAGQVRMLIELGEYREAGIWTDKALQFFPENPELLALKAVACARDGMIAKAIAYSDNSVTKDNLTARVWLARAEVMLERKSSVSDNCISKAVSLAGNSSPAVKLEAARLLRRRGQYAAAIGYLNDVVKIFPQAALAWFELGCCQAELGRPEAKASLEQSLKLQPHWEFAQKKLHKCKRSS